MNTTAIIVLGVIVSACIHLDRRLSESLCHPRNLQILNFLMA